jgi:hypothetical protein
MAAWLAKSKEGEMRTLLASLVFALVFGAIASPFVLYQMAEQDGNVPRLSGLATGIFAAIFGTLGLFVARMAYRAVSEMSIPELPTWTPVVQSRQTQDPRKRALQVLFLGLTIAFLSLALQHYPVYQELPLSWMTLNDVHRFFESGWGIYAGGLLALWGAYRFFGTRNTDA